MVFTLAGNISTAMEVMALPIPPYVFISFGNIIVLVAIWKWYANERKAYMDQAATDFYSLNTDARIDKAHRIFFHLYERGKMLRNGSTERRQEWDRGVQKVIREYCNEGCIDVYLSNTGRVKDTGPLPDDKYETALDHLHRLLKYDFENFFGR